ncbi:hypothetical protein SAMN04488005_1043 [Yoonia tamlensis]|uniref:SatD family (SatD) n=1 Tax=Yoonia tamlensis TaxID=390270 RepID=A0A1I6G432_9RHOB|nr:hypothetical protein [Yoonia tamlensis]SFR36946.1 hypothetical protein SAMN04488005_1043 [Yoonia tamlensis]
MTTGNQTQIAVLTGDIIGSTALGQDRLADALAALGHCAEMQGEWFGAPLRFTRHRGDGWQVVLAKPEYALRSALGFRAALRAQSADFDSYVAIATGPRPARLSDDLNVENSAAFIASGQLLDFLKATKTGQAIGHADKGGVGAAAILADHISQGWTQAQAATILQKIIPNDTVSFTEIAQNLGKSRQAVTKSLNAAGFDAIISALSLLEGDFD